MRAVRARRETTFDIMNDDEFLTGGAIARGYVLTGLHTAADDRTAPLTMATDY